MEAMNKPYTRTVAKNGMRVILAPQPSSVATTILVLVEAGSKYETKEINGLSHFLEHMCFKGTTKRPKAINIAGELDGLGAEYNAFTSQEWTGYYVKVAKQKGEQALEIISDLYLNPVFDAAEIEKEKGVIIEEMNMYEDMPQRRVQDLFQELLYGDQPAGWKIDGTKEVIRSITRDNFLKYRGAHYVARATAIVVAGAFDEKTFVRNIENQFSVLSEGEKAGKMKTIEKQSKPEVIIKHKESDQTHLVLGCRAFNAFDDRRYVLEIMGDIVGGGMSSRLFQKVREELGAAYYVRAGADLFTDHGFFEVSAGIDHAKIDIVIKAILHELHRLTVETVSPLELARAKDHLSGRLLLGLETSDALAMYYGGQEILRQGIEVPESLVRRIQEVSGDDIKSLAREIFREDRLNLALIGPYKDKEPFANALRLS
jgi:predicted Zn-dependent peptidase